MYINLHFNIPTKHTRHKQVVASPLMRIVFLFLVTQSPTMTLPLVPLGPI